MTKYSIGAARAVLATSIAYLLNADKAAGGTSEAPPTEAPLNPNEVVETITLALKDIRVVEGVQARVHVDESVIESYAETAKAANKAGTPQPFPPITVFRDTDGRLVLADGCQRRLAFKAAGVKEITANIIAGTERDAILYACGANEEHGLRRTSKDKLRALKILDEDPEWSLWSLNRKARVIKASFGFVKEHSKPKSAVRTFVREGKTQTMDTSRVGSAKGKKSQTAAAVVEKAKKAEKKAAAKKPAAKKGAPAATVGGVRPFSQPETPPEPPKESKAAKEIAECVVKICKVLESDKGPGEKEAKKFAQAVEDGTLDLNLAELKLWAQTNAPYILKAYPLVSELHWTVKKAFAFLDREIGLDSKIEDAVNHAIARGGEFSFKTPNGFLIHVSKS